MGEVMKIDKAMKFKKRLENTKYFLTQALNSDYYRCNKVINEVQECEVKFDKLFPDFRKSRKFRNLPEHIRASGDTAQENKSAAVEKLQKLEKQLEELMPTSNEIEEELLEMEPTEEETLDVSDEPEMQEEDLPTAKRDSV